MVRVGDSKEEMMMTMMRGRKKGEGRVRRT